MKTRTFASIAVMSALGLLTPLHAHAFGLGKIELSSALNQPFKAEIPVTALKADDEGKLIVQLASNAEFEKAGLKRSFLLTQLEFEVIESKGTARVLISSSQPVREPFIDFLLTATTGTGRLIREYTVLLDPPKNVFVKPKAMSKRTDTVVDTKEVTKPAKSTYKYPESTVSDEKTTNYSTATHFGPVGRTDTLWDIAKKTKPSSAISQNQMMMALLNANEDSFRHKNINGLKSGTSLTIPSVNEIESLSKAQAFTAVKEQNNLWKNRNNSVAPDTAVVQSEPETIISADVEGSETAEQEQAPSAEPVDEGQNTANLQLVSPTDEALSEMDELSPLGNKELSKLNEQLTLAQETIETQAQENVDIQSRMDLMEEQLQTLRQLITLKDADLARMQGSLEEDAAAGDVLADMPVNEEPMNEVPDEMDFVNELENDAEVEASENADSELSEVDNYFAQIGSELTSVEEDNDTVLDATVEQSDTDMLAVMEETQQDVSPQEPLDIAKDSVNNLVLKAKTFYTEYKQESHIAGFIAALLALIVLLFRGRSKKEESDSADTPPITNATFGGVKTETETEIEQVVDVPQAVEQAVDVEHVVESDMTETDENIIKAAYASLDDVDAVSVATEVNDSDEALVSDSLNEPEVLTSDIEEVILPITEPDVEAAQELEALDLDAYLTDTQDDELVADSSAELTLNNDDEPESTIEFNIDAPSDVVEEDSAVTASDDATETDDLLDFHVDSIADTKPDIEVETPALESEGEGLDFGDSLTMSDSDVNSLNLDDESLTLDITNELDSLNLTDSSLEFEPGVKDDAISLDVDSGGESPTLSMNEEVADIPDINLDSLTPLAEPDAETSELEFDLGDFDEIDEAETKLDLAGAYMDMGDPEGARSILDEVLIDGSDEQKSRAQTLLNDLT